MSVAQFKEYRNEIHEGVTGPTRMDVQKYFDNSIKIEVYYGRTNYSG